MSTLKVFGSDFTVSVRPLVAGSWYLRGMLGGLRSASDGIVDGMGRPFGSYCILLNFNLGTMAAWYCPSGKPF